MDIRHPANPRDFQSYTTERTREEFLIKDLFTPGKLALTYSYIDRMVIGGVCPITPLALEGTNELGTDFFLQRREMGVINVGPNGTVVADGHSYDLEKTDCLYIGRGVKEISFASQDPANPSRFYFLSGPAHNDFPTAKTTMAEAESEHLGDPIHANVRVLNKYIHTGGVKSCNLVMGITVVEPGSVWNSMPPCHTHARRMEVYFYFDLAPDAVIFHLMGDPTATRHIVMRNEEAVISPSWSIHCGAATSHYSFIWGMVGDNQDFSDTDNVDMSKVM